MIDVTHECDDRGTRLEIGGGNRLGLGGFDHGGNLVNATAFLPLFREEYEASFFTNLFCDGFFNVLVQSSEDIHLHEFMDELERFQVETGGKVAHLDRWLHLNDFGFVDVGCRGLLVDRNGRDGRRNFFYWCWFLGNRGRSRGWGRSGFCFWSFLLYGRFF